METFKLTRDRLLAWHRWAGEEHREDEKSACVICGYREGHQPWAAVVQWIKKEGFFVSQNEEGIVEIRCLPRHDATHLYRLIAGTGKWL